LPADDDLFIPPPPVFSPNLFGPRIFSGVDALMPDRCIHYQIIGEERYRCEKDHGHDGEHQKILEDGTRRMHWADWNRAVLSEVEGRCDET